MKKLLFPILLITLFCACASPQPEYELDPEDDFLTNSAICPSRKDEKKWARQTPKQMLKSNKIPSINFEFDSAIIRHSSYGVLDKVAEVMNTTPKIKLVIEGHTDIVGSYEYNDWLSGARASAIKDYLVSRGVESESIKTFGHGKRKPLTLVDSPEGRACNRRVTLKFTTRDWNAVF